MKIFGDKNECYFCFNKSVELKPCEIKIKKFLAVFYTCAVCENYGMPLDFFDTFYLGFESALEYNVEQMLSQVLESEKLRCEIL